MDSAPPSPLLEPGTTLDRYELLCTIARGGMAHVWLGRFKGKHGFEKLVAIKTILPEHALDARFRNMFLDEARVASGIDHPNVAKILDLGEWRDCLYLVMEYVDGDSFSRLRRTIEKRQATLPLPITLRIFADVCGGLHAAHELRGDDGSSLDVVHRDVSPQNVLIPTNGVAKLIDFGVAKARHRLGEETSAGYAKGKSRYMAPEQALGKAADRRADVFAVGVMLYELFENQSPYDGPNDMARLHALITGTDITTMKHAPHPMVEQVTVKALARDPAKRFSTAGEMRAAIEDAMVALKVRATPDDVAAFVKEHTAERMAERKRVVKLATEGAAERQRIKDMVEKRTVAGRRGAGSSPSLDLPSGDLPSDESANIQLAESASPPAFSATVGDHLPLVSSVRRRPWLVAVVVGLVLLPLAVLAFAIRNTRSAPDNALAAQRSAAPVDPPAPAHSVASAAPLVVASQQAPGEGSNLNVDAGHEAAIVVKPHASGKHATSTRHATGSHDVVIQ